ncbi:MAG TPA: DUF4175 family protein [Candidatus Kapabacteria bacterium]|nr:DUF4175 family protein [Candidatus Kapabacteria bacterium]
MFLQFSSSLLTALAAACCTVVFLTGIEAVFHLTTLGREIVLAVCIVAVVAELGYLALPSFLRLLGVLAQPSDDDVARAVGAKFPTVHDELINGMQLARAMGGETSLYYSGNLVEASFAEIAQRVQDIDFNNAIETGTVKRSATMFFSALLLPLAAFTLLTPFKDAAFRLMHYNESFLPPAPFIFNVEPGNAERIKGDSLEITVRTVGTEPQKEITLYTKESDEQVFHPALLQSTDGIFHYTFHALKRSTGYYASAKSIESDHYTITVIDRPEIKSLKVRLVYPVYTHTQPLDQEENTGDIVGLTGTEAQYEIVANKPIIAANIVFTPADTSSVSDSSHHAVKKEMKYIPLYVNGQTARGAMAIRGSGTYHIDMVDNDSVHSVEPIEYHVTALLDEYPSIQVVQPMTETDITDASKIGVITRIHDDYGFTKLILHYRLAQSKFAQPWKQFSDIPIPLALNTTDEEVPYIWDLSPMSLVPEDVVEYYLEVFDNDIISGPKSAKSEMHTLRLPSLDAVFKESEDTQNQSTENLKEAAKEADELRKEMEQSTRELREQATQKNLSWQEQKKMQDILNKQELIQKKVEQAQQQLQDAMQKLESHQALSPETLQKYLELQKLFQQLNSPELNEAMKRLQQAMQQMSPDQMRDAMKNFTFNEDQFKQSIERTMQILKRIQAEQKTDEMIKRAEELKNQQQQLQQQTQNAQTPQEKQSLDKQQQDLQQQAEDLEKQMKDLADQMKDLGKDEPQKAMQDAQKTLDSAQISKQMQQAEQQMQQGNMQQSMQHQQMAQEGLQKFEQDMKAVQQQMQQNEQRETMNEMRRALQDLLDLSKREEGIKQQTDQAEPNSSQLPDIAKEQAGAQSDLDNVVNRMMKIAQKSFAVTPEMGSELGKALRDMQNATGNLEQRKSGQASQNEGDAMGSMNKAAMMMQQALQQMGQGGSPGQQGPPNGGLQSFLQQLNEMAGQQEGINQQTQKLGNQGSLTQEQQQEMGRIAGEQSTVQKSLEQLQKEQEQMTGGKKNTLGDLSKIADDMQSVIKDMQDNNVNPETIRRQERILSRLLDAQRSQQDRDYDKKREGKAGTDMTRESPADLPSSLTQQQDRSNDLLHLLEQGYTKDYEERIKKYFEALQKTAQSQ